MFGQNVNSGNLASSNSAIQSGYKYDKIPNISKVQNDFQDALTLRGESELTEENIYKYARMAGSYKGMNAIARRLSRQKIDAARQAQGFANTVLNHAASAAQQELAFERMKSNAAQKLGETMIDINTEQSQFNGYSQYQHRANDLMDF